MSKTLVVGDIHLGKGLALGKAKPGQVNSRLIDQVNLLDWVIDIAIDRNVDRMILTGDVFEDTKPSYFLLEKFFQFLQRAQQEHLKIDIVFGNHDIKRTGQQLHSVLDLLQLDIFPEVYLHKYLDTLDLEDIYLTLMPFRDRKFYQKETIAETQLAVEEELQLETLGLIDDKPAILIGHLALSGSIPIGDEFDDALNEIFCPLDLFERYSYVWMGHVHKPQILKKTEKQHLAHIGSLDLTNVDEIGQDKILIYFDSKDLSNFETIKVPVRNLFKLEIEIPENIEDISATNLVLEELRQHQQQLLASTFKLEIKLPKNTFIDREQIKNYLDQVGVFNLAKFSETRTVNVVSEIKIDKVQELFEPTSAIKLWAEQSSFLNEEEKSEYLNVANSILEQYAEQSKE